MTIQVLAIVCDPEPRPLCFKLQRVGQTKIAKLEVMAICLTVRRNVHQISRSRSRSPNELLHQPATRRQCFLESDRACEWSIVEEDYERASGSVSVSIDVRL